MTAASTILNTAADLIDDRGWTQGSEGWPGAMLHAGKLCAEGALMAAVGRLMYDEVGITFPAEDEKAALDHLEDYVGDLPYRFNDQDGRTEDEVVLALRGAAIVATAREMEAAEQAPARELVSA